MFSGVFHQIARELREKLYHFIFIPFTWHDMAWSSRQLYPTLCNPTDCIPPGSSLHGIFQAKILEWVAISYSRGSLNPSLLHLLPWAGGFFISVPPGKPFIPLVVPKQIVSWTVTPLRLDRVFTCPFLVCGGGCSPRLAVRHSSLCLFCPMVFCVCVSIFTWCFLSLREIPGI